MIYQDNKGHRAHSRHTQMPWASDEPRPSGLINGLMLSIPLWVFIVWWLV